MLVYQWLTFVNLDSGSLDGPIWDKYVIILLQCRINDQITITTEHKHNNPEWSLWLTWSWNFRSKLLGVRTIFFKHFKKYLQSDMLNGVSKIFTLFLRFLFHERFLVVFETYKQFSRIVLVSTPLRDMRFVSIN